MDSSSDVLILSVNINDDRAGVGIKSNIIARETNFSGNLSGNLFEVYLGGIDTHFSEQNNLLFENNYDENVIYRNYLPFLS
jgi:hypothetical protein